MTYDIIQQAIKDKGIDKVRQIIYGISCGSEPISMQMFIDSRQSWCAKGIIEKLKESEA